MIDEIKKAIKTASKIVRKLSKMGKAGRLTMQTDGITHQREKD